MADKELMLVLAAKDASGGAIGKFKGEVSGLGKAAGGVHSQFVNVGAGIAKTAAIAAGIGVAGFAALASQVGFGIQALKEQYKLDAQSAAAIKSTGGAAGVTAKQIGQLADQIKAYSGIDDDAVKAGENLLLTFTNIRNTAGKGNDIFTQSTKVLADLSTAMGTDMKSSAVQLGKALNDPVKGITALTRVGVTFTAEQKEAIKAAAGLGNSILNLKEVGVQLSAQQKQQIGEYGDLADSLKAAKDLHITLTDAQKKQLKGMEDGTGVIQAQKIILAELNKEFGGSAKAFGDSIPGSIAKMENSFQDFQKTLATAVMPVIGQVASNLNDLLNNPQFLAGAAAISDAFATGMKGAIEAVTPVLQTLATILVTDLPVAIDTLVKAVNDWIAANQPLISQINDGLNVALQALGDALHWAGDNLNIVVPFIAGPLVAAFAAWAVSAAAAAVATLLALAPLLLVGAAIGALAVIWVNNWGDIQGKVKTVAGVIGDVLHNVVIPVIQNVGKVIGDIVTAAKPVLQALADAFTKTIVPAVQKFIDIIQTLWQQYVVPFFATTIPTVANYLSTVFKAAFDTVRTAVDLLRGAIKLVMDVIGSLKDVIVAIINGAIHSFRVVIDGISSAFGRVEQAIRDLFGPLARLADIIGGVIGGLQDIINLGPRAEKAYTGPGLSGGGSSSVAVGRAFGGPVWPGGNFRVGEHGMEEFHPTLPGEMVPVNAASTGNTFNLTNYLTVSGSDDPEQWAARYVQALARRLRREKLIA